MAPVSSSVRRAAAADRVSGPSTVHPSSVRQGGLLVAVVLSVATLALIGLSWTEGSPFFSESPIGDVLLVLGFLSYPVLGILILRRLPGNRIGWVFLASGLFWLAQLLTHHYGLFGATAAPGSLPGAMAVAWLGLWIGTPGMALAFIYLPLLFPDGRLPTRWHRFVAWFGVVAFSIFAATWATDPEPGYFAVANPAGIEAVGRFDLDGFGWGLMVLAVLATVAAVVVRYRRSVETERRQLQWLAYGAATIGLVLVALTIGSDWEPAGVIGGFMFPVAIASLPAAAFVAIFKHDLYDLDLVVSRTITFGVLAALIALLYVVLVAAIGALVGAGGSSVSVAVVATALVAVVFSPLRAWAQRLARRFVYGERAEPYEVLTGFAHQVGSAPDPKQIMSEMARLVRDGTGANDAGVWLMVDRELKLMASSPSLEGRKITVRESDLNTAPLIPDASHVVDVVSHDKLLGAISWTLPRGQSSSPIERRLVSDLAAQAALMFDNLRLVEELKASRKRIVAAQDIERRRLEKNIHDGVQQQLLTLALSLQSAAAPGPDKDKTLSAAANETRDILAELRRLARGIHPAIVTEGGIVAAIESLAERSPVPVSVDVSGETDQISPATEITMYYFYAEGLANVTKHSEASRAGLHLQCGDGVAQIEVSDDGVGGADESGSGLTGLTDRVAAAGGELLVDSPPGGGTRLRAVLPCE